MYILTVGGFLAPVTHKDDTETIILRSRRKEDIEFFLARSGIPRIKWPTIRHCPDDDFHYKADMGRVLFGNAMTGFIMDMRYATFKGAANIMGKITGDPKPYDLIMDTYYATFNMEPIPALEDLDEPTDDELRFEQEVLV